MSPWHWKTNAAVENVTGPNDFTREIERSTIRRLCRCSSATVRLNNGSLLQWLPDRLQPTLTIEVTGVDRSAEAATDATGLFLANMKSIQRCQCAFR